MDFITFIRRIGLSQTELAECLGTTSSNVNKWVNNRGVPSYELCKKLLLMGMTVDELFGKDVGDFIRTTAAQNNGGEPLYNSPEFRDGVIKAVLDLKSKGLI